MTRVRRRLACERGDALIEGLFALMLVLLVVGVAAQALAYAHARSVASAAAQDGVRAAAAGGPEAGVARASAILAAAGDTGASLRATAQRGRRRGDCQRRGRGAAALLAPSAPPGCPGERQPPDRALSDSGGRTVRGVCLARFAPRAARRSSPG